MQGDFAEHARALAASAATPVDVRHRARFDEVDGLVIPGGESTTIIKLLDRFDLREILTKRIESGMPVLATCAGAIILAKQVSDGEPPLGLLDIEVRRNAYGRQVDSFEADVDVAALCPPELRAVFIRAPTVERAGPGVEVLAHWADRPIFGIEGEILFTTFHPELTDDTRVHRYFVDRVRARSH